MESRESRNIESAWQKQKEILRQRFNRLTEQDLNFDYHRRTEMMGKLAHKLGMTTRNIEQIIDGDLKEQSDEDMDVYKSAGMVPDYCT
jgi:hypothetical protein